MILWFGKTYLSALNETLSVIAIQLHELRLEREAFCRKVSKLETRSGDDIQRWQTSSLKWSNIATKSQNGESLSLTERLRRYRKVTSWNGHFVSSSASLRWPEIGFRDKKDLEVLAFYGAKLLCAKYCKLNTDQGEAHHSRMFAYISFIRLSILMKALWSEFTLPTSKARRPSITDFKSITHTRRARDAILETHKAWIGKFHFYECKPNENKSCVFAADTV